MKIESVKSIKFDFSIFFTTKIDSINSINLLIVEQRDFAILRKNYKNQMRKYNKTIDVLKNLNIFILTSIIIIIIDRTRFDVDFSRFMRKHLCKICMKEKSLKKRKPSLYASFKRSH